MQKHSLALKTISSLVVFLLALALFGVSIFAALSYLFTCPPDHPACDLPLMAAFGYAYILSPILSGVAAILVFKHLSKQASV